MKALFLDMDGVLLAGHQISKSLDHEAVRRLDQLIRDHDLQVFLSSDWRHTWRLHELTFFIQSQTGYLIEFAGSTPTTVKDPETGRYLTRTRGAEIQEVIDKKEIESYVILDDLPDYNFLEPQRPYLVNTVFEHGFTYEDYTKAHSLLSV